MSRLQQGESELATRESDYGAAISEPARTPDLLEQLGSCSEVAQRLLDRAHEHRRHVASLRDELGHARSENDRLSAALGDLRTQATEGARREDELRAAASAEWDRAAAALEARSDLERRLVEVEDRLRIEIAKSDRLQSEAQAARDRLAEFEQNDSQKSTRVDGDLDAARLRIEQLTNDLQSACNANARLRSLLNVFGMVEHLQSR